jgi:hypothetical protein
MRLVKAGSLIPEARRAIEVWREELDAEANFRILIDENLLARPSRSRSIDIVAQGLRPRLQDGATVSALRELLAEPEAFSEAWAFHTMQAEPLLARFTGEALFGWSQEGRLSVPTELVQTWLDSVAPATWGVTMRLRVAQGLRAIARDFGLLLGTHRKELARPHLTVTAFAYVSFCLYSSGTSSLGLATHATWKQFLLAPQDIDALFASTARTGVFNCARVGSTWRIDWHANSLVEAVQMAQQHD